MTPSILLPHLLATTPATAQTRLETLQAGSTTDWITGSFLREHAQCCPALPNGSPGAAVPCIVYYLPPMPDAAPDSPYGQHLLNFEFSDQSVQLLLMPNSRNRLAYAPKPPESVQPQNNGWTHFHLTGIGNKPTSFYSNTQMLSYLNRRNYSGSK